MRVDGSWLDALWASHCPVCDAEGGPQICAQCLRNWVVRPVEVPIEGVQHAVALAPYDSATGDRLRRVKYGADRVGLVGLAVPFAERLAPWLATSIDAVVPVPSPWTRRARRGFATAAVLGRHLARRLAVPLVHALCLRPGRSSAGLAAQGRRANLARRVRAVRPVAGRVALVDDVVTTGATASACVRELLGEASERVVLAVLCATERRDGLDGCDTP